MTPEFKRGYSAANDADREITLDDKSSAFVAGFTQGMRDADALANNPDVDTLDF